MVSPPLTALGLRCSPCTAAVAVELSAAGHDQEEGKEAEEEEEEGIDEEERAAEEADEGTPAPSPLPSLRLRCCATGPARLPSAPRATQRKVNG